MLLMWKDEVFKVLLATIDTARDDGNLSVELDDNTDGSGVRELVSRWVEKCTNSYDRCRLHKTASFVPTQLLEINSTSATPTSRLVLRSECPKDIRYIALSYVWG